MNRNSASSVLVGIISICVGNALASVIMLYIGYSLQRVPWLGTALIYASFGIGLTQLIYVIPLCVWLRRRRHFGRMKGVIIGAVLTMLLSGGCFLMLSGGISGL